MSPGGRRQGRRGERRLALLALPALVFVVLCFFWPVSRFLLLAVDNSELSVGLAHTVAVLKAAPTGAPDEAAYAALVADLATARAIKQDALIAQALNQRLVGTRFLVLKTARDAAAGAFAAPFKESVLAKYPDWAAPEIWRVIGGQGARYTGYHMLASLDLRRDASGQIVQAPPEESIFRRMLLRTLWISTAVTLLCAALALPISQAIVSAAPVWRRVLFALVLFPLWSSLLVRTVIWIIVLQRNGPVNASLVFLGIVDEPVSLIYTRFSLYLAMIQVLLPLMILSVVSVMQRVPANYMKAALSLGAPWLTAWRTVQLPLVLPGILAGGAIVFVFSIGYYITPVLVGGPSDQMISSMIAFYTNETLNWNLAAALSIQVLFLVIIMAALVMTVRALTARRPA